MPDLAKILEIENKITISIKNWMMLFFNMGAYSILILVML